MAFVVFLKTKLLGLFLLLLFIICLVDEKMRERTLNLCVFCVFKFETTEHSQELTRVLVFNWFCLFELFLDILGHRENCGCFFQK